jgi:CxxC-x17-CxxC domain-containing protein
MSQNKFSIVCDKCKRRDSVPFQPKKNASVYCKVCYQGLATQEVKCQDCQKSVQVKGYDSKRKFYCRSCSEAYRKKVRPEPSKTDLADDSFEAMLDEESARKVPTVLVEDTGLKVVAPSTQNKEDRRDESLLTTLAATTSLMDDIVQIPLSPQFQPIEDDILVSKDYEFLSHFGINPIKVVDMVLQFDQVLKLVKDYFSKMLQRKSGVFVGKSGQNLAWPWEAEADYTIMPKCCGLVGSTKLWVFVKRHGFIKWSCVTMAEQWKFQFPDYDLEVPGAIEYNQFVFLPKRQLKSGDLQGHFIFDWVVSDWWFWKKTIQIETDPTLLAKGKTFLLARPRSKYNFQQLTENARRDWISEQINIKFPDECAAILENHIHMAWRYQADENARVMLDTMLQTSRAHDLYNKSLAGEFPLATQSVKWLIPAIGCAVAGLASWKLCRMAVDWWNYYRAPVCLQVAYDVAQLFTNDTNRLKRAIVASNRITHVVSRCLTWSPLVFGFSYLAKVVMRLPFRVPVCANILGSSISPFLEEYAKRIPICCVQMHYGQLILPLLIGMIDAFVNKNAALVPFHIITYCLPYPAAVLLHFVLPLQANVYLGFSDRFKVIKENMYLVPWSYRVRPKLERQVITYSFQQGYVERQQIACYELPGQCLLMKAVDNLKDCDFVKRLYYLALITDVPGFAIQVTPSMIRAGMQCRVLKAAPKDPKLQEKEWSLIPVDYGFPQRPWMEYEHVFLDWFEHIKNDRPQKYKRYLNIRNQLVAGYALPISKVSVFLKTDEILLKPDFQLKPRVIANVPSVVQVKAGPFIRRATEILKHEWDGHLVSLKRFPLGVRLSFGAGRTDNWLGEWLSLTLTTPQRPSVMAAGDDSIVYDGRDWYCCDASSYDQSQSIGVLNHAYQVYNQLGVPKEITDLLWLVAHLPYKYTTKGFGEFIVRRQDRPIRDTGGPDTCLGNTINMIAAWLDTLLAVNYLQNFQKLGFDMKMHKVDILHLSFLKGTWVQLHWVPLPSRILKVGYIKEDPQCLYHLPLEQAVSFHLAGVASSIQLADDVPILRAFIHRFLKPNISKVNILHVDLERKERLEDPYPFFSNYYSVPQDWFYEVEQMINELRLPAIMIHPLFEVMARIDYG